jgi:lactate racemase
MNIELRYGREGIGARVDDARVAAVLVKGRAEAIGDPEAAVAEALARPIGARPLAELARGRKSACVVVSDVTRPVPNRVILPPLLRTLETNGIARAEIAILIATGMHRPCTAGEIAELLGPETAQNYSVYNHNAFAPGRLGEVGVTPGGARVRVNRLYFRAELKVLTGLIEPHFMAGYSGGRKSICPGLTDIESLRASHGVECLAHPSAAACSVEGNPFHAEALAAARLAGCDFIVNVALDEERRITGIFAGDLEAAHAAGCAFVGRYFKAPFAAPAPVVLTTAAGHPLDLDFYQTVKGLVGALPAVAPGGTIIIASRCAEGLGSPRFVDLLRELAGCERRAEFLSAHRERFVPDQWQVQKLIEVLERAEFMIYSEGLTAEDAALGGGRKIGSVEEGLAAAWARYGPEAKVIAIPEGPYVVPELSPVLT